MRDSAAKDGETLPSPWQFICDIEVDYGSEENASIVSAALAVDKELQPDKVKRQMVVSGGKLSVHFEAVEARFLRASFSAFTDILTLATKQLKNLDREWNCNNDRLELMVTLFFSLQSCKSN